ncbi:MAG: hypothetical protein WAV11_00210 [Minisyncoccia bacterium]
MTKEEISNLIKEYNQRLLARGTTLEFIDFEDNNLELKFTCQDKTEFLVQGKRVTFADEIKKEIEKYLKAKINKAKIIFL